MLLGAGTAFAHVSVSGNVSPGSYSTITFRVPTESDTASTTKVEIGIPPDTPIPSVLAQHLAGWTVETTTSKLPAPVTADNVTLTEAVSSVTFTATDAGIGPGQFANLDLIIGPVPDVGSIAFTAVQTYSDGSVVEWNQPTPAGGEEPEHPAPVLAIADDAAGPDGSASTSGGASVAAASADQASGTSSGSGGVALALSVVAAAFAVAAFIVAMLALRRQTVSSARP